MEFLFLGVIAAAAGIGILEMLGRDDAEEAAPAEEMDTVRGTDGEDLIQQAAGTPDAVYLAGDGNDVAGVRGDSDLYGDGGDDDLFGRDESDIFGGAGDDRLEIRDDAWGQGDDGDDSLYGFDTAEIHGDAGNDRLDVYDTAQAYGGAGADWLNLFAPGGHGDGGDGDDALTLHPGATATGGDGADLFRILDGATGSASEITDFRPGVDRIALAAATLPQQVSVTSDGPDSRIEFQVDGRTTSVIVRGGAGLTVEDLFYDPSPYHAFNPDHLMALQQGTSAGEVTVLPDTPTALWAGAGNDAVTGGDGGAEAVDLGAGDDSYLGGESLAWVRGGAGNDDITLHMVRGLDYPDPSPEDESAAGQQGNNLPRVDGGDGNDVIRVTAASSTGQPLDPFTGLSVDGGAGDDLIQSAGGQGGMGGHVLTGGLGADTIEATDGVKIDLSEATADADQAEVTITRLPADVADVTTVDFDAADHVTLRIDPSLTGAITTRFEPAHDAEYGRTVPAQTVVMVGNQVIARLIDGTEAEIDPLADPRITVLRV